MPNISNSLCKAKNNIVQNIAVKQKPRLRKSKVKNVKTLPNVSNSLCNAKDKIHNNIKKNVEQNNINNFL